MTRATIGAAGDFDKLAPRRQIHAVPRRAFALIGLVACRPAHPAATPEEGYARLREAVRGGDARAVYACLDLRSRWAVMSIHRAEREAHEIVSRRFPPGAREREMARYGNAAATEDPAEFFAREYAARIAVLRAQVGRQARVEPGAGSAMIVTTDGARVPVARGDDGRWGFAGLRQELEARKVWSANALATVREGAARDRP